MPFLPEEFMDVTEVLSGLTITKHSFTPVMGVFKGREGW